MSFVVFSYYKGRHHVEGSHLTLVNASYNLVFQKKLEPKFYHTIFFPRRAWCNSNVSTEQRKQKTQEAFTEMNFQSNSLSPINNQS